MRTEKTLKTYREENGALAETNALGRHGSADDQCRNHETDDAAEEKQDESERGEPGK